jgi:serine/threonine protein kinase
MLTISDESLLTEFERAEAEDPSPVKVIDSVRSIYASRKFGLPKDLLWGQPVLCDFGETRLGLLHKGPIQSDLYRAPEVLFDMEWTTSVDIWSVATLVGLRVIVNPVGHMSLTFRSRRGTFLRIGNYSMP